MNFGENVVDGGWGGREDEVDWSFAFTYGTCWGSNIEY